MTSIERRGRGVAAHVEQRARQRFLARAWAVRVTLAAALVTAAGLLDVDPTTVSRYGYAVAFGWLASVGLLDAVRRRRGGLLLDIGALLLDWALLAASVIWVPPLVPFALVVQLPLLTYHAHLRPPVLGPIAVVASVALTVVGLPDLGMTAGGAVALLLVQVVIVSGLVLLQTEVGRERRASASNLAVEQGRIEAVLSGVGEAVIVTDPTGRIRRFTPSAETTFSCPADTAVGARCHDILELRHGLASFDCSNGCELLGAHAGAGKDVEVWRMQPTGARQPLLATAVAVVDAEGRTVEVLHSYRDITRIKQADEAKTLFLATTTHELKTPLTVIGGFAEMLRRHAEMDGPHRDAALEAITRRTQQLNDIVDRLLLSSRIESGTIRLDLEGRDLRPILGERITSFGDATGREVTLDIVGGRLPDEPFPDAWIDRQALTTVVDHLLDNAAKYSDPSTPIEVTLTSTDRHVSVAIRDHGIGMTPEEREHCFDRFYQAELSDRRRFGGTGIGLYIVRSLAEAMDGAITVTSEPGRGSCFVIEIARADAPPIEQAPDEATAAGDPSIVVEFMRQVGVVSATAGATTSTSERGRA